jgi:hypothetical protein
LKLFNMHIIILLFSSFIVSMGIFLCRNFTAVQRNFIRHDLN